MNHEELLQAADEAGRAAAEAKVPTPMNVVNMANPRERYHVPEGPCGFAWVVVKPNRGKFAKFLKESGRTNYASEFKPHYEGGISNWVHGYGQSVERKEAYARAFAEVLREAGFNAYSGSRMD